MFRKYFEIAKTNIVGLKLFVSAAQSANRECIGKKLQTEFFAKYRISQLKIYKNFVAETEEPWLIS